MSDSLIFKFGGVATRTPEELLRLCAQSPELGAIYLHGGNFERWLMSIGRGDLARVASESRRVATDPAEALHLFIEYCRMQNYLRRTPGRSLSLLLAGRTGVGKSSTLNTLAGRKVADTGEVEPITAEVKSYEAEINGIPSRIVDTPGLADGKNLDDSYIESIRDAVGRYGVDCMLFVTILHETRVRTDEIHAMEMISKAFGPEVWQRGIVLLTFADYSPDAQQFAWQALRRPAPIRQSIADVISDEVVANAIPFVPMTNTSSVNPDGRSWLGALQLSLLDRMAPQGTSPFYGIDRSGGHGSDTRFRCYIRGTRNPPAYRFICRSLGTSGDCDFCGYSFKKTGHER